MDRILKSDLRATQPNKRDPQMLPKALDERSLAALVEAGAAHECIATRDDHSGSYSLAVRIGVRLVPVRSQRDPVRIWRGLDGLSGFCAKVGIRRLLVEL